MKKIISVICILATVFSLMAGMGVNSNALTDVWEKEPNSEEVQANTFKFGQIMNANLTDIFDYDFFKVTIDTDVKFRLKFDHEYPYNINYDYWEVDIDRYNPSTGRYENCTGMTVGDFESTRRTEVITARAGEKFMISVWENNGASPLDYMMTLEPVISKPTGLKCTARTTSAEKVAWNKVSGVTGYQVQCSDGGTKWAQTKTGSGTSATFNGLTAGGKYKFRVRAYKDIEGTRYYSAWSPTLNSCAKPATVTLKGVSSPKHTQIKTIWAKAGGVVTGYQIVYSRNKAFTNIAARKNVTGKSTVTYTGKNFTKGRTYYIAVRAYTVFAGQVYYGKYSAIKAVKCK